MYYEYLAGVQFKICYYESAQLVEDSSLSPPISLPQLQSYPSWISHKIQPAAISAINKLRSSFYTKFWHDVMVDLATFTSV